MDPLLRLTIALTRLARRRWTRTEALIAIAAVVLMLAIGTIEWFGAWPDWMRATKVHRAPRW